MTLPKLALRTGLVAAVLGWSSFRCPAEVDFASQIRPIFQNKCIKCHGPDKVKSKFRLDSRAAALKGGSDGVAIIPGNGNGSPLIHLVEDQDMPPEGKGAPLSNRQITLLKTWINEGALWTSRAPKPTPGTERPQADEGPEKTDPETAIPEHPLNPANLPPAAAGTISFSRDVLPLLEQHCMKCHGPEKPKGGFRLDNRRSALKGGSEGIAIIPGNSAQSPLIHYVARLVEGLEMPPDGEGDPLSQQEIGTLRAWIDQGAAWEGSTSSPDFAISIVPALQWVGVSGNKQKFREHSWMREGLTGGLGRFTLEGWTDLDTKFTAEASAVGPGNVEFEFALNRQGVGYVRGGVEQFRRYYNNYGGYYEPFGAMGQATFQLDRNLHLDIGRLWAEVGITRPNWPEIRLGYEYRFRNGVKPTLHWGPSFQGSEARYIYPAYKDIDENVHILTAGIKYDRSGFQLENNFKAEWTDSKTQRREVSPNSFAVDPDTFTTIDESRDSFQLTNTFSVQKEFADWWIVSGGYYYSKLDSGATFQQTTINPMGDAIFGQAWSSRPIVLDWNAHIFNVSTRLGPWKGFTVSAGLQNGWERQSAIGNSTLFFSSTVSSNKQSVTMTEHLKLRYDRIPRTVLFAEVELEQNHTDHFEEDPGVIQGFLRDTEAQCRDQDYRAGFTLSPTRRVSVNAHYRYRKQDDDYDHLRDENLFGSYRVGYPTFILERELETHEFQTRLNLRPTLWLHAMLTYKMLQTDYHTSTKEVLFGDPPGGSLLAGEHDADIYGLNLVLTPWQRLSLNASLTCHDSRTSTASNDNPAVDDYSGRLYTALAGGRYILNENTDFSAHYAFSTADYAQSNQTDGLPLGIEYEQHSFQVGVSTLLKDNVRTQLQYRFQHYDEPSSNGTNDYSAHGIFANCSFTW